MELALSFLVFLEFSLGITDIIIPYEEVSCEIEALFRIRSFFQGIGHAGNGLLLLFFLAKFEAVGFRSLMIIFNR